MSGTIRIKGTGAQAAYRIEVSEQLWEADDSLEDWQESISDEETVARGEVSTADDVYNYTGEVLDVQIDGDSRAVIDPPERSADAAIRSIVEDKLTGLDLDTNVSANTGIRLVGSECEYGTIQSAWDAAQNGDTVFVHASYDAQSASESFPIVCDYQETEATITGGHPSGSIIDASHTDENILEVKGTGATDYQNSILVEDLTLKGGNVGLKVFGAPFSSFRNLICHENGSHGIELCEFEIEGTTYGTFGTLLDNCQAWGCGGNGIHLNASANPHGTTLNHCKATACKGIGYRLAGVCVSVSGGGTQLNYGFGIRADNTYALDIDNVYIEGNSRRAEADAPTEVYLRGSDGTTIEDCYFHGINPRGANHKFDRVQRGISAHNSPHLSVANCTVRRYGQGFVSLFGCRDSDVHAHSHEFDETSLWAVEPDPTARIRSDGIIFPCDLTRVDGTRDGDMGIHVSDGTASGAIWYDGQWHFQSGFGN